MLIGYARVSSPEQSLDLQKDALIVAGCTPDHIYVDVVSGAKSTRSGLDTMLGFVRSGDTLVIWKLDRLGRSLKHLIELAAELDQRDIGLKSLQENIDTTTASGRLFFHLFGALAEFERELIQERTNAGLKAARARGRVGGRRKVLSAKKIEMGKELAADKTRSIKDICELLQCSTATFYRYCHNQ